MGLSEVVSMSVTNLVAVFGNEATLEEILRLNEEWANLRPIQREKILMAIGEMDYAEVRMYFVHAPLDALHVDSDKRIGHKISLAAAKEIVRILREKDLARFS